jgi:hypothetical protein
MVRCSSARSCSLLIYHPLDLFFATFSQRHTLAQSWLFFADNDWRITGPPVLWRVQVDALVRNTIF